MHTQHAVTASIHLTAIRDNFNTAQAFGNNCDIMPVIKANAYGHGAITVAKHLSQYCSRFAVAKLSEALQLREAGITHSIVILSEYISEAYLHQCALHNFDAVIYSQQGMEVLAQSSSATPINIWLKVDTGMHRLGIDSEAVDNCIAQLASHTAVKRVYLMSHFATADSQNTDFMSIQKQRFKQLTSRHPTLNCSLANSAAILRDNSTHYDILRPGIMLYGADPLFDCHFSDENKPKHYRLQTTMTLTAPVIAIRQISAGESVGYNRSWFAGRTSTIAIIGIGYADGYPRHAKSGTPVFINGHTVHLVGTVSMDMIAVDISHIDDISIGDSAELWGPNNDVNHVAKCANTIAYELFTQLGERVRIVYS